MYLKPILNDCMKITFANDWEDLIMHMKSEHEGVKYPCDQCDYKATWKHSLKRHFKSKHVGVKHACDQCDHKATQRSDLFIHIISEHEGVRYSCDQCDYKAKAKKYLST